MKRDLKFWTGWRIERYQKKVMKALRRISSGDTNRTSASSAPGADLGDSQRSDSPVGNQSRTSPAQCKSSKGYEAQLSPRSPSKQIVPKMNKSRNEKFHKLFKTVPSTEICLKGYSCAYMGDILLQGYLYISPNWFCFHCKILGIEKQIRISVQNVLNITREKTAIFIPNAVGVVTAEDKYVFGSLMSRDNTYRIMFTVWKSLIEPDCSGDKVQDVLQLQEETDVVDGNGLAVQDGVSLDDSESDVSICMHCGRALHEHADNTLCDDMTPSESGNHNESMAGGGEVGSPTAAQSTSTTSTPLTADPPQRTGPGSLASCEGREKASVIKSTLQSVKKVPRTNYLLLVCLAMVIFLSISAVIMLHKILVLQAVVDSGHSTAISSEEDAYSSMYYLNHEYHISSIKRFHSVLEANINVLDQIHSSLKHLQVEISHHRPTNGSSSSSATKSGSTDSVKPDT